MAVGVLLLLWFASGYWYCAIGNGYNFDMRVGAGRFKLRCGERPGIGDKWFCADGFEFGANWEGRYSLVVLDWPWYFLFWQPFQLMFTIPLSNIVIPVAVLVLLRSVFRRRTFGDGRCKTCGYDLTGNLSGRCSECGTEVTGSAGVEAREPKTG